MKKFSIPCQFGAEKRPVDFHVGEPCDDLHPLHFQAQWLAERGGTLPQEVLESFSKLHNIAKKNGVSFEELCTYALGAANSEKEQQSDEKEKDEIEQLRSENSKIIDATGNRQKIEELTTLINEGSKDAYHFNNRGFAYISIGEFELAIMDLQKAIELLPNFAYAYNNLGFSYLKVGRLQEGFDLMNKSVELDSNNSYVYRNLAHYCLTINDKTKALEHLDEAQQLNFQGLYGDEVNELIKQINSNE